MNRSPVTWNDPLALPAENPGTLTGAGNNTYLLGGPECVLIDAGVGHSRHLEALRAAVEARKATLGSVLVTHAHPDHASGSEALAAAWSHARFRKLPWPERDRLLPIAWEPLTDGERIPAGRRILVTVHTPGHSPDHASFWDEHSGDLYCGDLIVAVGTVVIPASQGGDLRAYVASLEKVLALGPRRLLPAHGPAIDQPEIRIREYIQHRQAREDQILAALRAGYRTREAIVGRVYPDLSPALEAVAAESVLAHLLKLEAEHRAWRMGDDWQLR